MGRDAGAAWPQSSRIALVEHQRLATSGARTALPFTLDGDTWLAVPQLATDIAGSPAHMNGGNSDTDLLLFRWEEGRFVPRDRLPAPGGEDAIVFTMAGDTFLAGASIRQGAGPYDANVGSTIFRREPGAWTPFQCVDTFAAKQWHGFSVGDRHFLALAQGLTLPQYQPRGPRTSRILEWRDGRFELFQDLAGEWGYNWASFTWAGERFLAYADHVGPSLLLRWDGEWFVTVQTLADRGGRAFRFFEADGRAWVAVATIDGDTMLWRWDADRFVRHQRLDGPGGREFELVEIGGERFLILVRFIEGTPHDPKTDLDSRIFRWTGDGFSPAGGFATFGGTDATAFDVDGDHYLAVANSLTPDLRFRQDSVIYRLTA